MDYFWKDTSVVKFTKVAFSEYYYSLQTVDESSKTENKMNLQEFFDLFPSLNFLLFTLLFSLIYFLALILILIVYKFHCKSRFIFALDRLKADYIKIHNFKFTKILVFFYIIFFFFISLFVSNNISTSKVIVDTDDLITSRAKLFHTNREVCLNFFV